MGTRLDLVFPGIDALECDEIVKQIMMELVRIEAMLSIYQHDSAVSHINKTAHAGVVELDAELLSIFQDILQYHEDSGGYFDITMRPVFTYYQNKGGEDSPLPDEVTRIIGMDKIEVDNKGIRFKEKGVQVDLGGFGKGYAVKKVLQILKSRRIECTLLSFGESLVSGIGKHPFGDAWKISVPVHESAEPVEFTLKDETLSTSGNTLNNQKKFTSSGHIVNPLTLLMKRGNGLVSVKSADPLKAEVFSTALFCAGEVHSIEILKSNPDLKAQWLMGETNF